MSNARVITGPGFSIRFSDEPGYLRAHVFEGTDSLAVSIAMWQMLGEECHRAGATKLLVLEELQGTVDLEDVEQVIQAMVDAGFASVKIAFVELLDDIQGSEHGEILCLERGIVIHTFSSEHPAFRWLLYGTNEIAG